MKNTHHYVIKFVIDLRQVVSSGTLVFSTNKSDPDRTLSSIKQKFQKGAWPKCFIQDIVQYKAKVYTTPFINAVKLPIAV